MVVALGLVDTPFFSGPKPEGPRPENVAAAVVFALEQSKYVGEVYLMPVPGT